MRPSFDKIWNRIKDNQRKEFKTIRGKEFTYILKNDSIVPDRTEFPLSKNNFLKALDSVPMKGPGSMDKSIMGTSYVWAILHDKRIRKDDW